MDYSSYDFLKAASEDLAKKIDALVSDAILEFDATGFDEMKFREVVGNITLLLTCGGASIYKINLDMILDETLSDFIEEGKMREGDAMHSFLKEFYNRVQVKLRVQKGNATGEF